MQLWKRHLFRGFAACALLALGLQGQELQLAVSPLRAVDPTLPSRIPDSIRQAPVPAPFSAGLLSVTERRIHQRGPLVQTAVRRALPGAALEMPNLSISPDGRAILTASIRSPGATRVRLHFRNFHADSGEVWVFAPGDQTAVGPYTGDGTSGTGEFWAGGVASETVVIAYVAPPDRTPARFPFGVDFVAHTWPTVTAPKDPAASCNLDVSCYPDYKTAAAAVVQYEFIADDGSGAYTCSGAMINTRSNSRLPYMLTAHHCISSNTEAQTIQAFFLYQTSACNGTPPSITSVPTVLGGSYMAGADIASGDFSLVLLHSVPGGVTFLGWNAALDPAAPVVGIHHPRGSYTRISFGTRGTDADTVVGSQTAPAALYYEVNWSSGVTEPGSSGSPLLNAAGQIVGTLTGAALPPAGETVCQAHPFGLYGRFTDVYQSIGSYLEDGVATAAKQSLVSVAVTPSPVYQQPPDADGFQWSYTLHLAETAGMNTLITSLKIGSTDYSALLSSIFPTTSLPALSTLASGTLRAKDLAVPMTTTIEVAGVDTANGHTWTATTQVSFLGPKVQTQGPAILAGGIGNAASYTPTAAPGSLLTIFGTNLALSHAIATTVPLPMLLGGTRVTINGIPAPLFAVSPGQLNVQLPFEISAPGIAQVTVTVNGLSDTAPVQLAPAAPGVFALDSLHPWPAASGRRGDQLILFITGQGALSPAVATGTAPAVGTAPAALPRFAQQAGITIGGKPAPVSFAGIPSGLVGVAQITFEVPLDAPLGDQPLVVSVGHALAPAVTFTVNP